MKQMAEFPALPLWTDAYLADTLDLTLEEHGAYLKLLMIAWRRPTCAVPDDDTWIARTLGCHGKTWRKLRPGILEKFFVLEGAEWVQKRLVSERSKAEKKRGSHQKSARLRWAKTKKKKDLAEISHEHTISKKGIALKSMKNVGAIPFQHPDSQNMAPAPDAKRRRPLAADGQRPPPTATKNGEITDADWKHLRSTIAKPAEWQTKHPLDIPPALKAKLHAS